MPPRSLGPCPRGCGRKVSPGRRGLCWRCSRDPAVRAATPMLDAPCNRRGVGDRCGTPRHPAKPTAARPGTPEKVAAMTERARLGVALFHPADGLEAE